MGMEPATGAHFKVSVSLYNTLDSLHREDHETLQV
jgi:hypothetical protein